MENRDARLLWHTKGYAPKIVMRPPESHEGSNGDIVMGTLSSGTKLFVKINNKWYTFSADRVETNGSNVVNFSAYQTGGTSGDGTVTVPNKVLKVEDSGKTFIVDISEFTSVFRLPPVRYAGTNFKFILSHSSDGETSKDLAIITNSTTTNSGSGGADVATLEKIVGNIMVAGVVLEIEEESTVQINSSAGVATWGDWLSLVSDGSYWYIDGSTVTASSVVTNEGHVLAT